MSCEINLKLVMQVLREASKPVHTKYIIEHICEKILCAECVAKPMVEAILQEGVSKNILGRSFNYFIQPTKTKPKSKANAKSKKIESNKLAVNVNESSPISVDQTLLRMDVDENCDEEDESDANQTYDTSSNTSVKLVYQDVHHRGSFVKCNRQGNERLNKDIEFFAKKFNLGAKLNEMEAKFNAISMNLPTITTAHNEEPKMVKQAEIMQQPNSTEAFNTEEELTHTSGASKQNNVQYTNNSERVNEDSGLAIRSSGLKRKCKTVEVNEEESVLPAETAKLPAVASDIVENKRKICKNSFEMCVEEAFLCDEESIISMQSLKPASNKRKHPQQQHIAKKLHLSFTPVQLKKYQETSSPQEGAKKCNILVPHLYKNSSEMCVEEAFLCDEESIIFMQSLKPASNKRKRPQQQHMAKKLHLSFKPVQLKKYQETSSPQEGAKKCNILVPRLYKNSSEMYIEAAFLSDEKSHISLMSVKQQQQISKKFRLPLKPKTSYCKFRPKVQKQIDFSKDDTYSDSSPDVSDEREAARLFKKALNAKRPATRFGAKKKFSAIKNQKAANPKANFCKPKIMQRNQSAKKHNYVSGSASESEPESEGKFNAMDSDDSDSSTRTKK